MKLNKYYDDIKKSYLFVEIANRVKAFSQANPDKELIKMGIGDVTRPLAPAVIEAGVKAVQEMGDPSTFRGYSPDSQGYEFLRETISNYYLSYNVKIDADEIHVSDGAKSDCGNIVDIFDQDNVVLIPDPVYPVYNDSNIMSGRKIVFIDANESNGFNPRPDKNIKCDIIYLCSPNNPTGAVMTKSELKEWVDYALEIGAVIIFDAAYESFIMDKSIPRSIYEIEGSRECAIEMCSLSKVAGFTGTRCGYTIMPKELMGGKVAALWGRRQSTKFNGVSYIQQRMAQAALSGDGLKQSMENVNYYMENAKLLSTAMTELNIYHTGGTNSPYVWLKCNADSWTFFDKLLNEANVVGTPGSGFGKNGEGFFRLTAFNTYENTVEAINRIKKIF